MKTNITKTIVATLFLGAALLPLAANASDLSSVNWRLHHQQQRITAGARDHQLTRHEQYALDARDSRIRTTEDRDRETHDGRLTSVEHRRLERDLNHTSGSIYRQRRNGN